MDAQKVVFVGNSSSGKTTACRELMGKPIMAGQRIASTMGVEVHPYTSPKGNKYKIWDLGGKHQFRGLGNGYYHGAIMAFVFHGGESYFTPQQWEQDIKSVAPNIQIVHISGSFEQKQSLVRSIFALN